jgi:hypothetical protein
MIRKMWIDSTGGFTGGGGGGGGWAPYNLSNPFYKVFNPTKISLHPCYFVWKSLILRPWLIGIQLPEKYNENISLYFSGSCMYPHQSTDENLRLSTFTSRPCYTVQFFLQLAMQFYSWGMLISEISEEFSICWENISGVWWRLVFGNFTSLKSRIALQVARKIAPSNMAFRLSCLYFTSKI